MTSQETLGQCKQLAICSNLELTKPIILHQSKLAGQRQQQILILTTKSTTQNAAGSGIAY